MRGDGGHSATPDELRAIDDAFAETGDQEPARIIAAAIERHAKGDPAALAQAILVGLASASYEVRRPDDLIKRNRYFGKRRCTVR